MSADPTTKTALDLITGALRKIGQYAPGETLSAADANDALDTVNGLLDLWSNQHLAVYNNIETIKNLNAGQSTYTVGTGGYFNIERPLRIDKMYSRITTGNGSVDFQCEEVTLQKYGSIGLKSQPGPWPKMAYYNTSYPLGEIIFWPVPSQNVEFHLWTDQVFTSMNLTDPLNMPRGYYLGFQFAVAEVLCPEYGIPVPPDVRRFAKEFKQVIKAMNANPQAETGVDPSIVSSNGNDAGWILTGGFQS
jgi:hypothetical protein